jgi:luciferase family oxidoreductase group 1
MVPRSVPLSILDLAPVAQGSDVGQALRNALDLARHAEQWGYERVWYAEHHNMPGVASAATAVVIGHVAAGTTRIRVGAGGIMLPNHAPLVIAEQFGTLEALFPGRIDLGVGRAPGSDGAAVRALRRHLAGGPDHFPDDLLELMRYLGHEPAGAPPADDRPAVQAVPGAGSRVPIWILGSSLFGAQVAAALGLPYAFASHFAPGLLDPAIETYRQMFRPSAVLERPRVMLGVNVIAADTDQEAELLLTSLQQVFLQLRRGRPGQLPPPIAGFGDRLGDADRAILDEALACTFVGAPATVRQGLLGFLARTGADELIVSAHVFDHAARLRSLELTAAVGRQLSLGGEQVGPGADQGHPAGADIAG